MFHDLPVEDVVSVDGVVTSLVEVERDVTTVVWLVTSFVAAAVAVVGPRDVLDWLVEASDVNALESVVDVDP